MDSAAGYIIGGIIGVVCGVFFEEPLNSFKEFVTHSIKRLFFKKPHQLRISQSFSFGPIHSDWVIVDGDGEEEYSPKTIITHFDNHPFILPDDLEKKKEAIEKEETTKKRKGLPYIWNGERYALEKFVTGRIGTDEDLLLNLWFRPSEYYTFLATNMQLADKLLREKYIGDTSWQNPIKYFANSFGLNLCVITEDEYLIIPRRSEKVGVNKNHYGASINEGLSRLDRGIDSQSPDIYRCAIRGIAEEMGITDVTASDIQLLSLGVDTRFSQWGMLGFVKVEKKIEEILAWRARGIKDKWESDEFHTVKFELHEIVRFVFEHEPFTPAGLTCIYQTLVHEFKRTHVDAAIAKYEKRHK